MFRTTSKSERKQGLSTKISYQRRIYRRPKNPTTKKYRIGKGNLFIQSTRKQTEDQSRNNSALLPKAPTTPTVDAAEIDSSNECEDSPAIKLKRTKSLSESRKCKINLERDAIGYIDSDFNFVVPNFDLREHEQEQYINLDKLNIFKALGIENSPVKKNDKFKALEIIKQITMAEYLKYKEDPVLKKVVKKILNG